MAPSIERQFLMSQRENHLVQNVFFAKLVWFLMRMPLPGISPPGTLLENDAYAMRVWQSMKKVLVFFNAEPCKVISVVKEITSVRQAYPNGEETYLQIMSAGFPSLTGDHGVVYVATDRDLARQEILDAAKKYL